MRKQVLGTDPYTRTRIGWPLSSVKRTVTGTRFLALLTVTALSAAVSGSVFGSDTFTLAKLKISGF